MQTLNSPLLRGGLGVSAIAYCMTTSGNNPLRWLTGAAGALLIYDAFMRA